MVNIKMIYGAFFITVDVENCGAYDYNQKSLLILCSVLCAGRKILTKRAGLGVIGKME